MSWAEYNWTFAYSLQLPDSIHLKLIDDNLAVNTSEEDDTRVTECFESWRLVVGHDDIKWFCSIHFNLLINFILVHLQLERVLVVVQLLCNYTSYSFLDWVSLKYQILHILNVPRLHVPINRGTPWCHIIDTEFVHAHNRVSVANWGQNSFFMKHIVLDSIGMVHRKRLPIYPFDVYCEYLCFCWIVAPL